MSAAPRAAAPRATRATRATAPGTRAIAGRRAGPPLVVALLAALTGLAVLAGCSHGTGSPAAQRSGNGSATSPGGSPAPASQPAGATPPASGNTAGPPPLSSTDLPTLKPPTGPPKQPMDGYKVITVQGAVRVAGACRTLDTGNVLWTITGPVADGLRDGDRAEVTGVPAPEAETTCPGGVLKVQDAHRL